MRYTPHTKEDVEAMLKEIGAPSIKRLYAYIPKDLRAKKLKLADGIAEADAERELVRLSQKNKRFDIVLRGAGAYDHYIPPVVKALTSRSEFVTAYTPYQAELSQGILQSIFEYQTIICRLTAMDASNASHYDGGTAAAEAALMTREKSKNKLLVAPNVKPQVLEVLRTYLTDMEIVAAPEKAGKLDIEAAKAVLSEDYAALYIEQPNYFGLIEDIEKAADLAHAAGAKLIAGVYPITAGLLKRAGDCGADIAVGEGQPLGMPLSFGGPYLGFMAAKKPLIRKLPGRIVGETVDREGKRAFVLTLQAREQHIRREKASSNICSNQAHCALTAATYVSALCAEGLKAVAQRSVTNAHYLKDRLSEIGFKAVYGGEFFNEFLTESDYDSQAVSDALKRRGILGGLPVTPSKILWCATEKLTKADIDKAVSVIKSAISKKAL